MRTELLPISSQCAFSQACHFCSRLGYRSKQNISDREVEEKQTKLASSISKTVALPCSSVEHQSYDSLIGKFEASQIQSQHIFYSDYWLALTESKQQKLKLKPIAIFFTSVDALAKANLPRQVKKYFLVLKSSWNLNDWQKLPSEIRNDTKMFFVPNTVETDDYYSAVEVYAICEEIFKLSGETQFETPFGHDLLDRRNEGHLNWIFEERPIWINRKAATPKISIIIPTYNRKDLLFKVLNSLNGQSLSIHDFEVIVLDDGGTDRLGPELKLKAESLYRFDLSYFFVRREIGLQGFYIGNRAGPIRNMGAKWARANLFLFLDSDILIANDYLDKLLVVHRDAEVVSPRRFYLSKNSSLQANGQDILFQESDRMLSQWQEYLTHFYETGDWESEGTPWKFFMTFCLSVSRKIFVEAGGFRTNYISYGYEDLDFGYRAVKLKPRLKLLKTSVYHLYHFEDSSSEYGIDHDFKFFQLTLSSRMFIFQNVPWRISYLKSMATLKTNKQKLYYFGFKVLWQLRLAWKGWADAL